MTLLKVDERSIQRSLRARQIRQQEEHTEQEQAKLKKDQQRRKKPMKLADEVRLVECEHLQT